MSQSNKPESKATAVNIQEEQEHEVVYHTNHHRIGEKFLEWTDIDPSIDSILESVTLYWLTATFPRAMYPYVQFFGESPRQSIIHGDPKYHIRKPMGYSWFPKELAPMPVAWVATTANLVWSRRHVSGGHFAAMECPEVLLGDIEAFVEELR